MDWKVALLYVLFCLLTLALLLCGILLWLFVHRERYAARRNSGALQPPSLSPNKEEAATEKNAPAERPQLIRTGTREKLSPNSRWLWERLSYFMEEEEVWRNPDLTLNELSIMLGSNRTRLCQLVQEAGYEGYKDFINRYRIHAFLQLVHEGNVTSIQDALFSVGYQSKMTALRHFKTYTGMTPTEYLHSLGPTLPGSAG